MANTIQNLQVLLGCDSTGLTDALTTCDKALKGFGSSFSSIIGGLSLGALAADVIKMGLEFEDAGAKIQRATGATGTALAGLEDSMRGLYETSTFSASEVGNALTQISIKSGAFGAALQGLTAESLNFAKVSGQDVNSSVETSERLFSQWNLTADAQQLAMDHLTVAWQNSGGSMSQLQQTMTTVGPVLRGLGMSFDETLSLVSSFQKHGLELSDIMMGLSAAMRTWAKAGEDPISMLDQLIAKVKEENTTAGIADATFAGLGRSAIKFVDDVKSGAFDGLDTLKKKLEDSSGATNALAQDTKTLSGEWTKFWHSIEGGLSTVGTPLLGFLNSTISALERMGQLFSGPFGGGSILKPENLYAPHAPSLGSGGPLGTKSSAQEQLSAGSETGGGPSPDILAFTAQTADQARNTALLAAQARLLNSAYDGVVKSMADMAINGKAAWQGPLQDAPQLTEDMKQAGDSIEVTGQLLMKAISEPMTPFAQLETATKTLGITSSADLSLMAASATAAYGMVKSSGIATANDITKAWLAMASAQLEADKATGVVDDKLYAERKANIDNVGKQTVTVEQQVSKEMGTMAQQTFTSLERALANDLIHWKGWAKSITDIFSKMGEDILSMTMRAMFQPLEKQFAQVMVSWATNLLTFLGLKKTSESEAATSTQITNSITDTLSVSGSAAVGGAAAAAAAATIFWWDPAAAVAAGAAMAASIGAVFAAPAASAAGGWDLPGGGPFLTTLHSKEMVLPSDLADNIRSLPSSDAGGSGVHFHGCTFSGVTQSLVNSVFQMGIRQARLAGAPLR